MNFKCSWENEVQRDLEDRRKSVEWALGENNQNTIEKGVADMIPHSDTDLKYLNKKGSEIKEKLIEERSRLGIKLAEKTMELSKLSGEIKDQPDKDVYYPQSDKFTQTYSYKMMNAEDIQEGVQQTPTNIEITGKMRLFNQCVDKFHYLHRELKYVNTLINGIKDKKEYKLNLKIASELGF